MRDPTHSGSRERRLTAPALITLIGPRTTTLIGSCVAVLTAYTLGLEWVAHRFLGIPVGLLIVGLCVLIAECRRQAGPAEPADTLPLDHSARTRLRLPSLRSAVPSASTVGGVLELVGVPGETLDSARKQLSTIGARLTDLGNRPIGAPIAGASLSTLGILRIGVDLAEADAEALILAGLREENLGVQLEWTRARAGLVTDVEQDMAAAGLDVLIRRERRGDINVFIFEHPERPAAWHDWGMPLPLGYPGVFPPRIDPARISLAGCELSDAWHTRLAAQIIAACAMLARAPGRAATPSVLSRVLVGRVVMPHITEADGPLAIIMRRIAHTLETMQESRADHIGGMPAFARSAARACGAVLAGDEAPAAGLRADLIAAAARATGDEPEALLRQAAAEVAAARMDDAKRTLLRAAVMLRSAERRCQTDPLAFVMSEVELGTPGRMALGRVAAGIALAWATAPAETLDYLREDLMDDLAHAGWLRSRPGDVDLLKDVLETLERGPVQRLQAA